MPSNNNEFNDTDLRDARRRVPRSRGATSGLLLLILGAWGALIPLLGPIVHFGFAPDKTFKFTVARFWLEILPGAVVVVGALILMGLASRVVTSLGAWLAVAGGAWFIIGNNLMSLLHLGTLGLPLQKTKLGRALDGLLLLDGLGALILFFATLALGRLGVVSVRDVRAANRRAHRDDDNRDDDEARDDDEDNRPVRRTVRETEPATVVVPVQTERTTYRGTTIGTGDVSDADDADTGDVNPVRPRRSHGTGGASRADNPNSD